MIYKAVMNTFSKPSERNGSNVIGR